MKPAILIVDDEVSLCNLLEIYFQKKGYAVESAHNLIDALKLLDGPEPILAMVDLSLGQDSGLTLVKALLDRFPRLPVVVMTAYGTVEKAVEAVKLGAFDFISKPVEMVFLGKVVEKAVSTRTLETENRELKALLKRPNVELVGQSAVIHNLRVRIEAIAPSESTVLITGESGTGKELVAKLIHQKSLRAHKAFVVVNCSALSENLLESEIFGHLKGAFTSAYADKTGLFAAADEGTIFLDEIGDMPLRTQVKLLRVLQEREITPVGGVSSLRINVRVLAATNVDLEEAVAKGEFREDLYYRLNVLRINTPSLAERGEDSALLADYFLRKKIRGEKTFSHEAMAQILAFSWPGNVRQLENAVERAIAFSPSPIIENMELDLKSPPTEAGETTQEDFSALSGRIPNSNYQVISPTLIDIEKAYIYWVLSQNNWQKPLAAKILGLDLSTLYRKIERYGLKMTP